MTAISARQSGTIASVGASLLLLSGDAHAQGLTGGLAGLREAFFLLWGVGGTVPAVLLAVAFSRARHRGRDGLTYLLTLPAVLYVPIAMSLMVYPSSDLASKFPGLVGFGLLIGLIAFYLNENRVVRTSAISLSAVVLVTLLLIPNDYWNTPFLSFEHVEFVDNVAPRELTETLPSRSASKRFVALADGRHLVQSADGKRRSSSGKTVFPKGELVVLSPAATQGAGRAFQLEFFNKSYPYATRSSANQARFVVPLSTRTEDMYQQTGTSLAVVLDAGADVDHEQLLADVLRSVNGWSIETDAGDRANTAYWVGVLTGLAGIELSSADFLSEVYRGNENRARFHFLVDSGVSVNAVTRDGSAMLHIAARDGDVASLRWLIEQGADIEQTNRRGRTALDVARARHARAPLRTPIKTIEQLLLE